MFSKVKQKFNSVKEKFMGSKVAKVTTITTGIVTVSTSSAFADTGSSTGLPSGLDDILSTMTGIFNSAQTAGITIVKSAIGLGVVFLVAKWLWGKTRQWLSKA